MILLDEVVRLRKDHCRRANDIRSDLPEYPANLDFIERVAKVLALEPSLLPERSTRPKSSRQ